MCYCFKKWNNLVASLFSHSNESCVISCACVNGEGAHIFCSHTSSYFILLEYLFARIFTYRTFQRHCDHIHEVIWTITVSFYDLCAWLFLYARLKNGRIMPWQCPSVRPSVRVFRTFLQHALRYQFETWYIHLVGGTTYRVRVASQLGHFDLVYSQK